MRFLSMNSLEQNFYFSSCMPWSSIFLSLLAFDCAPRVSADNGQSAGFLVSLVRPLHKVPIRPRNPKLGVCPHSKHGGRHLRQSFARSDFAHRSAKRDTKAVENVRLPANIRGALSNLKKTGIIADGRGMRVRKMKFCDRMRWQESASNMPSLPKIQKKNCVRRASAAGRATVLFRYIKCLTNR